MGTSKSKEPKKISVGDVVTIIGGYGEETYQIRPRHEVSDPSKGSISEGTPLAQALLGSVVGKEVVVSPPESSPYTIIIHKVE